MHYSINSYFVLNKWEFPFCAKFGAKDYHLYFLPGTRLETNKSSVCPQQPFISWNCKDPNGNLTVAPVIWDISRQVQYDCYFTKFSYMHTSISLHLSPTVVGRDHRWTFVFASPISQIPVSWCYNLASFKAIHNSLPKSPSTLALQICTFNRSTFIHSTWSNPRSRIFFAPVI